MTTTTITVIDSEKFLESFIEECRSGLLAAAKICDNYFITKSFEQMYDTLYNVVIDNMESDHCAAFRTCARMCYLCEDLEEASENGDQYRLLYLHRDVAETCWTICSQLSGIDDRYSGTPCNGDFGYHTITVGGEQ